MEVAIAILHFDEERIENIEAFQDNTTNHVDRFSDLEH